jgi:HAD superfamily hydrolase (TIGR01549 family)
MIKWIFFDLGDVIFNEDYLRYVMYEQLFRYLRREIPHLEFSQLMDLRKRYITRKKSESPILAIAYDHLPEREFRRFDEELRYFYRKYHGKYIKIVPGMRNLLLKLKYKYSLGIIANQPKFIMKYLKSQKLEGLFKAIYISDIVGIKKPDIRIFNMALKENRIRKQEAVFIGNRMEHDILPSMQAGMIPVMAFFPPEERGSVPSTFYERMFFEAIRELSEWPQNLRLAGRYARVVTSVAELEQIDWEKIEKPGPVKEEESLQDITLGDLLKKIFLGDLGD